MKLTCKLNYLAEVHSKFVSNEAERGGHNFSNTADVVDVSFYGGCAAKNAA